MVLISLGESLAGRHIDEVNEKMEKTSSSADQDVLTDMRLGVAFRTAEALLLRKARSRLPPGPFT